VWPSGGGWFGCAVGCRVWVGQMSVLGCSWAHLSITTSSEIFLCVCVCVCVALSTSAFLLAKKSSREVASVLVRKEQQVSCL
jgi:hypothetical protein